MQNCVETIYINGCKVKVYFSEEAQPTVLPSIENILLNQLPGLKNTSEICDKSTNML